MGLGQRAGIKEKEDWADGPSGLDLDQGDRLAIGGDQVAGLAHQGGDCGLLLLGLIGLQLISQAGDAGGELLGLDAEVPEAGSGLAGLNGGTSRRGYNGHSDNGG